MDETLVRRARELAMGLARSVGATKDDENVDAILKRTRFNKIKEQIEMARMPRMRTIEQFLCDQCDCIIQRETDGFIVKGNIYTADTGKRGGLVGNNFPEVKDGEKIDPEAVMETVLCVNCFLAAVGLRPDFTPVDEIRPRGQKIKGERPKRGSNEDVADLLARTLRHETRR